MHNGTKALLLMGLFLLPGCSLLPWNKGLIKTGGVTVRPVENNGKPATLNTSDSGESIPLDTGSVVRITKTDAIPATDTTPAKPAVTVTEITPSSPTVWAKKETKVSADSGTIDTSIAQSEIKAKESRPLLYASLGAIVAAAFFVWAKYPTPAIACGVASVVFFMAWKVSGMPDWFWAVGLLASGVGVALYLGHEKGELNAAKES